MISLRRPLQHRFESKPGREMAWERGRGLVQAAVIWKLDPIQSGGEGNERERRRAARGRAITRKRKKGDWQVEPQRTPKFIPICPWHYRLNKVIANGSTVLAGLKKKSIETLQLINKKTLVTWKNAKRGFSDRIASIPTRRTCRVLSTRSHTVPNKHAHAQSEGEILQDARGPSPHCWRHRWTCSHIFCFQNFANEHQLLLMRKYVFLKHSWIWQDLIT